MIESSQAVGIVPSPEVSPRTQDARAGARDARAAREAGGVAENAAGENPDARQGREIKGIGAVVTASRAGAGTRGAEAGQLVNRLV